MALTATEKIQIKAKIRLEKFSTKELANQYNTTPAEINKVKRSLKKQEEDEKVEKLADNLDKHPELIEIVTQDLPDKVKEDVNVLIDATDGLNKLKAKFQETGYALAKRIEILSSKEDIVPAELLILSKAFNETVQAFSTSNTTVFMNNQSNTNTEGTLALFKQSLRK